MSTVKNLARSEARGRRHPLSRMPTVQRNSTENLFRECIWSGLRNGAHSDVVGRSAVGVIIAELEILITPHALYTRQLLVENSLQGVTTWES